MHTIPKCTGVFGDVDVRLLKDPDPQTELPQWRLLSPLSFRFGEQGTQECFRVTVPKDYVSDFASLPRIVRLLFNPADSVAARAALLHDRLYSLKGEVPVDFFNFEDTAGLPSYLRATITETRVFSREECDILFRRTLRADGCSRIRTCLYFYAVRIGGGNAWNSPEPATARELTAP